MASEAAESIYQVEQIARLPNHLKRHIVGQEYERYTSVDHAVWRYIMRKALDFHSRHAHPTYVEGLRRTGISLDRIPRVEEMNAILSRIGWGAAPVDGFIPPAAFMEFQAHRVLVIAADIRQLDHIEYTPAPDIVHEAAGHAPIIADPEYAEYLRRFGEVGAKAMSSRADFELYEAIRHLSILKEAPGTPAAEVAAAEQAVAEKQSSLGDPSEMARLSRLHWWTVEYGLIGTLDSPRLYGAGLLSSIGEATHCLTAGVEKLPYSLAAADVPFDITTMQPQLFVTPSFAHLIEVLEQFADTMAFRRGGLDGLERALASANVATVVYSSGLQVSGLLDEVVDEDDAPLYIRTKGPTALAVEGRELAGHGKGYHADGFGAPVGRPSGARLPIEACTDDDLGRIGLRAGHDAALEMPQGIRLKGRFERVTRERDRVVLLTFSGCRVTRGERVLFDPAWGTYDMAVGDSVTSVFQGAADKDSYDQVSFVPHERTIKVEADAASRDLQALYEVVRAAREGRAPGGTLGEGHATLQARFPEDWLASLETLEILEKSGADGALAAEVRADLERRAASEEPVAHLIRDGLRLLQT
jgi:phenylalanine-4-hydroxylase